MPFYFVVLAESDNREIVRLSPDGAYAVKWPDVLDQAYAMPTERNRALIGVCRLLLGAKDNFRTTSWAESEMFNAPAPIAPHIRIGALEAGYGTVDPSQPVLYIANDFNVLARVNFDLSWSMQWPDIAAVLQRPIQEVCLTSICRLFLAAKDNFVTSPW